MLQAIRNKAASFKLGTGSVASADHHAIEHTVTPALASRAVAQVMDEQHAIEGPGFEITRPFPTQQMRHFSPWLLFDSFGPKHIPAGHPSTVRSSHLGQHPHRGFQAITYMIQGSHDHYDSTGKHGRLEPGSVQLMTAGGGIVHGGAPTPEMQRGGWMDGYQIWLALPATKRMMPASTVDLHEHETPTVSDETGAVWARVLCSATPVYGATCTLLRTEQPVMLVHYVVQPGGAVRQVVPASFTAMVHVNKGAGRFGPGLQQAARAEQAVFFERGAADGSGTETLVEFSNPPGAPEPLDVLLLAGEPLPPEDKVVQYGPFVGGSMHEIAAARTDFNAGLMGALAPDGSPAPKTIWAVDSQGADADSQ